MRQPCAWRPLLTVVLIAFFALGLTKKAEAAADKTHGAEAHGTTVPTIAARSSAMAKTDTPGAPIANTTDTPVTVAAAADTAPATNESGASGSALDFDLASMASPDPQQDGWTVIYGGYIESRNQYGVHKGKFLSTRQKIFGEAKFSRGIFSLYLSGEGEFDPSLHGWEGPESSTWRAAPKEYYVSIESSLMDVYLGQRIVTWGTGDGINPLDLINPDDTRDPAADVRTRSKRPVPMAHVVWKPSFFTLEAVVLPWAQVNRRWAEHSPWAPQYIKTFRQLENDGLLAFHENDSPEGVEGGIRLSKTVAGWDLALIYFNGLQDHPVYSQDLFLHGMEYREKHPRMQAFGATFATGFYGGTFRGELAWNPNFTLMDTNTDLMKADYVRGVVGIDQTFGKNLYGNIQYFLSAMTENRYRAGSTATMQGFTFSVSDLFFDDALELGVKGVLYTEGKQGASAQPYVTYTFQDNLKATLAYSTWGGPETGSMGQYRDNDMVTCTVRYSF